jgi:tetratricopeptide (TPR) repeat protein
VADLAYHYARSSDHEKALLYLMRAAERSHAAASYHEEATLLGQAVEAADHLSRSQLVKELHARRGRAFRAVDQLIEAENEFMAALDGLAPEHIEQRIEILIDLGEVCLFLLKVASMRRYASEALKLAEQIGRDDLAAQAMAEKAMADESDGEVVASIGQFQRAFARAGPDHRRSLVVGLAYYGQNLYYLGHYDEAADHIQEVLDFAQSSHDTVYILSALGNLLLTRAAQGRYQDAFQLIEKARRFAREYGSGRWVARIIAMWGGVHLDVGDYAGAEVLAEESCELARSVGFSPTLASAGIDLLMNYVRRHEVGRAESLVDMVVKATAGAQGIHGWLWRLRLAQARAEIALERGDYEEALRHVDDSLAQSRLRGRVKYQVAGLVTRGQTLVAMGQVRQGIADLRRAVGLARQLGDPALLLRATAAMLALDGNDRLLVEARATLETVAAALPDEEMLRCFLASDQARLVKR